MHVSERSKILFQLEAHRGEARRAETSISTSVFFLSALIFIVDLLHGSSSD